MNKKSLGCKITEQAFSNIENIGLSLGKYPTGAANEILESFRDIEPEKFYEAIAALKKAGRRETAALRS